MQNVQPNDPDFGFTTEDKKFIDETLAEGVSKVKENGQTMNQEAKEVVKVNEFKSSVHLDGYYKGFHFEVIEAEPDQYDRTNLLLSNMKKRVEFMIDQGFEPSWNKETNNAVKVTTEAKKEQVNTPEAPVCGIHGTQMFWKEGTYKDGVYTFGPKKGQSRVGDTYGFWSCSTKNADGSFCNYKPPKKA